jgi:hypothetical protein
MDTILYENLTLGARVTYFEEKNMVLVDSWGDHSEEASYKLYFETFLRTYPFDKHACLLIDTTKLTKSTSSNRAWFSTSVAPRFFKGFQHPEKIRIGIVIPKGLFEKIAIEILIKAAVALGHKVQLKSFNDAVEAEKYVNGVQ